jgi:tetratricopeptide (TPR) repeat protein
MKLTLRESHILAAAVAGATLVVVALAAPLASPALLVSVAAVFFVAALPLAASLAVAVRRKFPLRLSTLALIVFEGCVMVGLPQLYIHALRRSELREAELLLAQSRYGEASARLHEVGEIQSVALLKLARVGSANDNVDRIVRQLEQQVAAPLARGATDDERLARARALAMLGRTQQAFLVLDGSKSLTESPDACNLRGAMDESRGQWRAAHTWYKRAADSLRASAPSPERDANLAQSLIGIAYSARKLGHLKEAAAAWQELLRLAPTAETHFRLAQFYDDTQQTAAAADHARRAMALAPGQYAGHANQLLQKLSTSHFGCLLVPPPAGDIPSSEPTNRLLR